MVYSEKHKSTPLQLRLKRRTGNGWQDLAGLAAPRGGLSDVAGLIGR